MIDELTLDTETRSGGWYSEAAATFGDRVAAGREARGYSQADLARKLGVKLKTVQAWEDDLSEPRANKLQILAGVLNVSLMWLLSGQGEGLADPDDANDIDPAVDDLLTEIREVQAAMSRHAAKLVALEKRLRRALRETR